MIPRKSQNGKRNPHTFWDTAWADDGPDCFTRQSRMDVDTRERLIKKRKKEHSVHHKMRPVNHVMSGYAMIFIISNEIGNLHLLTWILNEKLPRLKNERGKDRQKRFSSNSNHPVNFFLLILTHDHRGLTPSSDRLDPRAHFSQPGKNMKRMDVFLSICQLYPSLNSILSS